MYFRSTDFKTKMKTRSQTCVYLNPTTRTEYLNDGTPNLLSFPPHGTCHGPCIIYGCDTIKERFELWTMHVLKEKVEVFEVVEE